MNMEQLLNECAANRARATALMQVKRIKETSDIAEVAQMLSTGEWIAICATTDEPYRFVLGRVSG